MACSNLTQPLTHQQNRILVEDVEDEGVVNQITSVKAYIKTLRKNPQGMNFNHRVQQKYSSSTSDIHSKCYSGSECNNTKKTILLAKSIIRTDDETSTSLSATIDNNQSSPVQCIYDTVPANNPLGVHSVK